jgi:hypothetical protein
MENQSFEILAYAAKDLRNSEDPHRRRIGPLLHAVYSAIARYTNTRTGQAFPHVRTICEALGAGRSQVFNALAVLEEYYLVARDSGAGRGKGSVYMLLDAQVAARRLEAHGPGRPPAQDPGPAGGGVRAADGGVRAADGGVRAADAPPEPLRQATLTAESTETPEPPQVSARPRRPSKRRKSAPARAEQDGSKGDEENNRARPAHRAGRPQSLREILANVGGKDRARERKLLDRIVTWLTDPSYPHAKKLRATPDRVRAQIRRYIEKLGIEPVRRAFEAANGANPHPSIFWSALNASCTP